MTQLTILNAMAGTEFEAALDRHIAWGLHTLDLKDSIFGKGIADLTDEDARHADRLIRQRNLSVTCFSTGLFHADIEKGENTFRQEHLAKLEHVLAAADILRPTFIRLLAATTARRKETADSIALIQNDAPWLLELYGEAVERITQAGFQATIENEVGNCIFASPNEIRAFFALLGRRDKVCLTWDVQNLWQMGVFPSLEVYAALKDLIGYYHLKGGQSEGNDNALRWRSPLETASWPVRDITKRVIADGVSPVICLNPSHGARHPDAPNEDITARDIAFAQKLIQEYDR